MKNSVVGFFLILSAAVLAGCGINEDKSALAFNLKPKNSNELVVSGNAEIESDSKYLEIKRTLFDTSCIRCHNPKNAKRLDLTVKANILENYDDILYRITDAFDMGFDYMPPKGEQVKPEVIKELKAWKSDMKFADIQKTLFSVSCLKCHGPSQKRHIDLSSKEVVIENFDEIIYKMTNAFEENNKPMPPVGKGVKVSPELIDELQKWKASL